VGSSRFDASTVCFSVLSSVFTLRREAFSELQTGGGRSLGRTRLRLELPSRPISLMMPDGSSVSLDATATDLQLRPLRGKVEGKHRKEHRRALVCRRWRDCGNTGGTRQHLRPRPLFVLRHQPSFCALSDLYRAVSIRCATYFTLTLPTQPEPAFSRSLLHTQEPRRPTLTPTSTAFKSHSVCRASGFLQVAVSKAPSDTKIVLLFPLEGAQQ
jgi:hypothetical protein